MLIHKIPQNTSHSYCFNLVGVHQLQKLLLTFIPNNTARTGPQFKALP